MPGLPSSANESSPAQQQAWLAKEGWQGRACEVAVESRVSMYWRQMVYSGTQME